MPRSALWWPRSVHSQSPSPYEVPHSLHGGLQAPLDLLASAWLCVLPPTPASLLRLGTQARSPAGPRFTSLPHAFSSNCHVSLPHCLTVFPPQCPFPRKAVIPPCLKQPSPRPRYPHSLPSRLRFPPDAGSQGVLHGHPAGAGLCHTGTLVRAEILSLLVSPHGPELRQPVREVFAGCTDE